MLFYICLHNNERSTVQVVVAATNQNCIREVLVSDIGHNTGYTHLSIVMCMYVRL
jgi:hypothetical protein